jgi:hypothetical protein
MVKAFSFCLFGPTSGIYHRGFLENVELAKLHFPGWVVYVYFAPDTASDFVEHCHTLPNVRIRFTTVLGFVNTVWRFYAIDEPDVEVCFFRDADSRIHWKDRWAIKGFMNSTFTTHIVRDHREHTAMIAAGMWGIRKVAAPSMRSLFDTWTPVFAGNGSSDDIHGFGIDQNFLTKCVYPLVRPSALVHYSNKCLFANEIGVEFPFTWSNDVYCGKKEGGYVDTPGPRSATMRLPSVFTKLSR